MHPLRAYRDKEGLSQQELADKLGVSRQMVGLIETGERAVTPENAKTWERVIPLSKEILCPEIFGRAPKAERRKVAAA